MQIDIIPIGNSRGIRIPKALLEQCEFGDRVEIAVKNKQMILKKATKPKKTGKKKVRQGWEAAFKKMAKQQIAENEDVLLMGDFPNEFDHTEWEW